MSNEAVVNVESGSINKFPVTDMVIREMEARYMPLKIEGIHDKAGYLAVREARIKVKTVRIDVEKTRKELKEESLRYGRMVDSEAKRITTMLEPIEIHLETQEKAIDAEKERLREERDRAEKAKLNGRLQKLVEYGIEASAIDIQALGILTDEGYENELARAKGIYDERQAKIAEEARQKKAEEERLAAVAAEQAAERERLSVIDKQQQEEAARIAAEQAAAAAKIKAEQDEAAAKIKAAQDELDAKARAFEAEKQKAERDKIHAAEIEQAKKQAAAEAEAKIKSDEAVRLKAEQDRVFEEARIMALRPDVDKLNGFAAELKNLATRLPDVSSSEGKILNAYIHDALIYLSDDIISRVKELKTNQKESA